MKKKLLVKEIEDRDTNVPVNSGEHRIAEIKTEIKECFSCPHATLCKSEVFEMWKE